MYKVFITTSGTGSRLGKLTVNKNKSLIKINGKEILSYIIDIYPKNIELIVTLGYLGDQVKEFLQKNYSDRKITYVNVDKYKGKGSSLAYSMLQSEKYLQCPFIFHCNDTIVFTSVPAPLNYNWNAGSLDANSLIYNTKSYSSFSVSNREMTEIKPKGAILYDYLHIGLVGIKDYRQFWNYLEEEYKKNPNDSTLNDVVAINKMLLNGIEFELFNVPKWFDTGSRAALEDSQKKLKTI